jgi:hypothetical protein
MRVHDLAELVMLSLRTRMHRPVAPRLATAAPGPAGPDARRERKVRL